MSGKRIASLILIAVVTIVGWSPFVSAGQSQELRVVAPWPARGLEPVKSGYIFSRMGCLERLTTIDEKGRLVGQLAESWSVSEDKLTWTFKLRPGVEFHDGSPLTAQVAAASLNRLRAKKGILARVPITSIEAGGPDLVVIKTETPFAPMPAFLCHYSAGVLAPASLNDQDQMVRVIGTGPYKLVEQKGGKLFRFEAFDRYWGKKPHIAKTSYHAIPKGETRGFTIRAGQAEMAFTLSPMDAEKIEKGGRAKVVVMTIPRTRLLKLNCNLPYFNDVRVRRAISLGIDRKGIAKTILRNPASAATQLLAPGVSLWHDPNLPPLGYDPEEAKRLLNEAGWKLGPDGIRVKNGKKFQVELATYSSRPMLPLVAAAIQDQLKQIGLKIDLKVGQAGNIAERHQDGTLEMALLARNYGMIPEPIGNLAGDFGPGGGKWGAMGWESESLTNLLRAYLSTFDTSEVVKIRSNILAILQEQLPVIPVSWYENIVAYSDKIENVVVDPLEVDYFLAGVRWAD